jgi:hypothetical protein
VLPGLDSLRANFKRFGCFGNQVKLARRVLSGFARVQSQGRHDVGMRVAARGLSAEGAQLEASACSLERIRGERAGANFDASLWKSNPGFNCPVSSSTIRTPGPESNVKGMPRTD